MIEKGWYGPAVLTLLATFVGFIYMVRFIKAIFLGPRKQAHEGVLEAPMTVLVPQYLLIVGILVMSFFPKPLISTISEAIDPEFASTLVWQGMSLEMIYSSWNPAPVMLFAVVVSTMLLGLFLLLRRAGLLERLARPISAQLTLYDSFRAVLKRLTPPLATMFWSRLATTTSMLAMRTRLIYTGNGQTYSLYILYYFLVVYAGGGIYHQFPTGQPQ
jgi:NADH:ubiquinone oxidoreductase subunit 5 (subunit L)/multisubunit Na+/H+ antiporter MnhA subunit